MYAHTHTHNQQVRTHTTSMYAHTHTTSMYAHTRIRAYAYSSSSSSSSSSMWFYVLTWTVVFCDICGENVRKECVSSQRALFSVPTTPPALYNEDCSHNAPSSPCPQPLLLFKMRIVASPAVSTFLPSIHTHTETHTHLL
jgi:hypothetical protein